MNLPPALHTDTNADFRRLRSFRCLRTLLGKWAPTVSRNNTRYAARD